jgi:hypothetical protein
VGVIGIDSGALIAGRRRWSTALIVTSAALLAVLLATSAAVPVLGLQVMSAVTLVVTIVLGFLMGRSLPGGLWSPPVLVLLVLALFHEGLLIQPALGDPVPDFLLDMYHGWFTSALIARSAYIVSVAIAAYSLTTGIVAWARADLPPRPTSDDPERAHTARRWIAGVGAAMLVAAVLVWVLVAAAASGPFFFLDDYELFLAKTAGLPLGTCYLVIQVAVPMVVQDLRGWMPRAALIAFAIFSLLGLPLGLRGEVMYPVAAALAVIAIVYWMPSGWAFLTAVILALFVISGAQQVRAVGLDGLFSSHLHIEPSNAVEEMGYSIRVVQTSVQWHEVDGEPYLHGASYWAPIERAVEAVAHLPRVPAEQDDRLMNVEILERVGPIGGSIIGEAHHNEGVGGAAAVLALVGAVLALLTTARRRPFVTGVLGLATVAVIGIIRNSATDVAPLLAWGGGALVIALVGSVLAERRRG